METLSRAADCFKDFIQHYVADGLPGNSGITIGLIRAASIKYLSALYHECAVIGAVKPRINAVLFEKKPSDC